MILLPSGPTKTAGEKIRRPSERSEHRREIGANRQTLKRKSRMSPSFTTYSFPSDRIRP